MKQRPIILKCLIGVYFLAPVFGLAQLYFLVYGGQWVGWPGEAYWSEFDFLRILILALYPWVGFFLLKIRTFSWWVYTGHSAFLVGLNSYEIAVRQSFPFGILLFILLGAFGVVVFYFRDSLREIFLNPRLRWWEVADRYSLFCPVRVFQIQGPRDEFEIGFMTDLSRTGGFFYLQSTWKPGSQFEFAVVPEFVRRFGALQGRAEVVRHYFEPGVQRMGYGVVFRNKSWDFRRRLAAVLGQLKRAGNRDRKKMNPSDIRMKMEEFGKR